MNAEWGVPKRAKPAYYVPDGARSEAGVRLGELHRNEDGAAAVEFAIVVTLLMMIVFGILEYGLWISEYEAMTSGAREGARAAAVRSDINGDGSFTAADIQAAVADAVHPYTVGPGTPTADKDCSASGSIGTLVTVSWAQHFNVPNVFFLVPHSFLNSDRTIKGAFRCE